MIPDIRVTPQQMIDNSNKDFDGYLADIESLVREAEEQMKDLGFVYNKIGATQRHIADARAGFKPEATDLADLFKVVEGLFEYWDVGTPVDAETKIVAEVREVMRRVSTF